MQEINPTDVAALIGPGVAVAVARPEIVPNQLYPAEQRYIAKSVNKRRAEFGTARVCARRALRQLGVRSCPLVPNPDGSPRWPAGIVGSISHTDGCCIVAVGKRIHYASLGLDIEPYTPLPPELWQFICTPTERSWAAQQSPDLEGLLGKFFFSAKEAFYKYQYPISKRWLDFHDVEIEVNLISSTFTVKCCDDLVRTRIDMRCLAGRYLIVAGYIVTTIVQ